MPRGIRLRPIRGGELFGACLSCQRFSDQSLASSFTAFFFRSPGRERRVAKEAPYNSALFPSAPGPQPGTDKVAKSGPFCARGILRSPQWAWDYSPVGSFQQGSWPLTGCPASPGTTEHPLPQAGGLWPALMPWDELGGED